MLFLATSRFLSLHVWASLVSGVLSMGLAPKDAKVSGSQRTRPINKSANLADDEAREPFRRQGLFPGER